MGPPAADQTTASSSAPRSLLRNVLFTIAMLAIAVNSYLVYRSQDRLADARRAVAHTEQVRDGLAQLMIALLDAETGKRGYLITGRTGYLEPYHAARRTLDSRLARLDQLAHSVPQKRAIAELRALVQRRFEAIERTIEVYQRQGPEGAAALIANDEGRTLTDDIRARVTAIDAGERAALAAQTEALDTAELGTWIATALFVATILALLALLALVTRRELADRQRAALQLSRKAAELDLALRTHARERDELAQLSELSSFVQSSDSVIEAARLIPPYLKRLFPGHVSAIYQLAASRNQLSLIAADAPSPAAMFPPEDCWAVRRGRPHAWTPEDEQPRCAHFDAEPPGDGSANATAGPASGVPDAEASTVCLPLNAHGETLGLLVLTAASADARPPGDDLAAAAVRQMSIALANLRLRERLRQQSVRDALTGLYNRRYLEEILLKETAKALRSRRQLAVMMLDIDHFKHFNDDYGHAAGDKALTSVASFLVNSVRESDWVFRYGGEEITVLLLDTAPDAALAKAEELRRGVAELRLSTGDTPLRRITVSIGLATCPEHGGAPEALLKQADDALYQSKKNGRNRVTVASAPEDAAAAASIDR